MVSLFLLIITSMLLSCKQPVSQLLTVPRADQVYKQLVVEHTYLGISMTQNFDYVVDLERQLATALSENKFTHAEREQLERILHKTRSIIAYAVQSRCFKKPKVRNRQYNIQSLERNWRDRYDYNYYQRGTKDYMYQLSLDNEKLCSIFLNKMSEISLEHIDLSHPNTKFFQNSMSNKIKALNDSAMQDTQQKFFKHALAPQIMKITTQSMAQADYLFAFHSQDWVKACQAYRDYYFEHEAGDRTYRFPKSIRDKINCQALQTLAQVEMKTHEQVDCADSSKSWRQARAKATIQPFADIDALSAAVNERMQGMNEARAELDALVKRRELDKIKSSQAGKDKHYTPHREKKSWILPFMKVLHATKIAHNPPVLKAIDTYNCHLVEANKQGVLPIIFAQATQKAIGSVHLNHLGRFFGFGKITYKPLKLPSTKTVTQAVSELKRELLQNWVEMQVARAKTKNITERKIYATILNNEIAVAQLLLQNPAHAVVVNDLLLKFQFKPVTPKWLRTFKKFALAADLAFIPIAILGGFVTGGAGLVPILLMANAVNFLWIGGATAEQVVARNRYRLIERALLTGNSEQIARGMKVLRALHEKRRDLIISGGVGATLSLTNLTLIARGLDNLATVPIDVAAAFSADVETLSLPDEAVSDAAVHKEKH